MAKDIPSKKYKGVYYRELKNGDRSYFIITRVDGKQKRLSIGKKSEGITEQFCYQQKVNLLNAARFGDEQAAILQKVKKTEPTFTDLVEHYAKHSTTKPGTKNLVKGLVKLVPFADKRRISQEDVAAFIAEYGQAVRPATVNSKIKLLRMLFDHAINMNVYRHATPMRGIKTFKEENDRLRYLSKEEVEQLLDAVADDEERLLFTKLALNTGARLGTLINVHQKDIKGDQVRLYNIKASRWYTGFLDAETEQLLKGRKGYVLNFKDPKEPPKLQYWQYKMRVLLDELFNEGVTDPLERVVIHTLRHTTASLLVQNGTPIHVVQKVLDHKSIKSTERYAKLHQDNIKSELHRLWN